MSNQITSKPNRPIASASHGSVTRPIPATRTNPPDRSFCNTLLLIMS